MSFTNSRPFRAGVPKLPSKRFDHAAASAPMVLLADVSEFEPDIADAAYLQWSHAIIIRAAYGDQHDDHAWYGGQRRQLLHAAGIRFLGIYQYLVSGQTGQAQAQEFHRLVGSIQKGEVFIADFEEGDHAMLTGWYNQMLTLYGKSIGPYLWTYTGLYFGQAHGALPVQWIAAYQNSPPATPHTLWQFTDRHPIPGVGHLRLLHLQRHHGPAGRTSVYWLVMTKIRLLICYTDKSVTPLPWCGENPQCQHPGCLEPLEYRLGEHTGHRVGLADVEENQWEDPYKREVITGQIAEYAQGTGQGSGLGEQFYEVRDTFADDAMRCWKKHNRTKDCGDWKTDKMRLYPDTRADRKELGLDPKTRPSSSLCDFCLTGNTEVVTDAGISAIDQLSGKTVNLLVPFKGRSGAITSRGSFEPVTVSYFGDQPTFRIKLRKGRSSKVICATAEHRWFVKHTAYQGAVRSWVTEATTVTLRPGDRLQNLKATGSRSGARGVAPVPFGIAQGFVFGDGACGHNDRRPAKLPIYDHAKDMALFKYFVSCEWKVLDNPNSNGVMPVATQLPRHWKKLPPLDESRSFLLSWLAGYFAADGNIQVRGSAELCSAEYENLKFVRSLLAVCGAGYGPVRTSMRKGLGQNEPSPLYRLSITARDLPEWFWLLDDHKERAIEVRNNKVQHNYWIVDSVESTGLAEPVYCATVPEIGAFGLADNIMTGNCPVTSIKMQRMRKDKYRYNFTG